MGQRKRRGGRGNDTWKRKTFIFSLHSIQWHKRKSWVLWPYHHRHHSLRVYRSLVQFYVSQSFQMIKHSIKWQLWSYQSSMHGQHIWLRAAINVCIFLWQNANKMRQKKWELTKMQSINEQRRPKRYSIFVYRINIRVRTTSVRMKTLTVLISESCLCAWMCTNKIYKLYLTMAANYIWKKERKNRRKYGEEEEAEEERGK